MLDDLKSVVLDPELDNTPHDPELTGEPQAVHVSSMGSPDAVSESPTEGETDVLEADEFAETAEGIGPPQLKAYSPELEALFEQELLPHIKPLYRFAFKLTNDEDDANDLVQDTYLKAYRFLGSYQRGSNAKAWLFRILKNSFINNYRRQSKEPNKVDYEEAETYLSTSLSPRNDTIDGRDKHFRGLIGDEVAKAINSLPVDFRTVVILCDIEEFTYEEIAKIVNIPIGTVRSRLHRARKMLRDVLTDYALSMGYSTDQDEESVDHD